MWDQDIWSYIKKNSDKALTIVAAQNISLALKLSLLL